MTRTTSLTVIASIVFLASGANTPVQAQQNPMSFFVTGVGLGKGGDLGGLDGADARTSPKPSAQAARLGTPICRRRGRAGSTPRTVSVTAHG